MRILHLTDLHVEGRDDSKQLLRPGYFREYIESLANCILSKDFTPDLVLATGDFSHKNSPEGFSLAARSIKLLVEILGLSKDCVFVIPGNHDYDREEQRSSRFYKARDRYRSEIESTFAMTQKLSESVWFSQKRNANGSPVHLVGLDTTWGNLDCIPGAIWHNEADEQRCSDELIAHIRSIPHEELLLILSHYPIHLFDSLAVKEGEVDYATNHLASKMEKVRRRIQQLRRPSVAGRSFVAPTIWFYGDVHKDQVIPDSPHLHSIAGRLDKPLEQGESTTFRRHSRLLHVSEGASEWLVESSDIEWKPETHRDTMLDVGNWEVADRKEMIRLSISQSRTSLRELDSSEESSNCDVESKQKLESPASSVSPTIQQPDLVVCDAQLNLAIRNFVSRNTLLTFRRAHASTEYDRITHIELGPLFNDIVIRGQSLRCFAEHLIAFCTDRPAGLIGMDVWGSSIARELGLRTGLPSVAITLRGASDSEISNEIQNEFALVEAHNWQKAVFVTDVIASGSTLQRMYRLTSASGALTNVESYGAVSEICPKSPRHRVDLAFLTSLVTICDEIALTTIESSHLPHLDLLRCADG